MVLGLTSCGLHSGALTPPQLTENTQVKQTTEVMWHVIWSSSVSFAFEDSYLFLYSFPLSKLTCIPHLHTYPNRKASCSKPQGEKLFCSKGTTSLQLAAAWGEDRVGW